MLKDIAFCHFFFKFGDKYGKKLMNTFRKKIKKFKIVILNSFKLLLTSQVIYLPARRDNQQITFATVNGFCLLR